MIFAQRKYNAVKKQHPRTDAGGISMILGRLWRTLSPQAKARYYKAAKNDRYSVYRKRV